MKRIKLTALIAASALCIGVLAGCGSSGGETASSTTSSTASTSSTESTNSTASTDTQAADNQVYSQDFTLINNTGVEIYELYVSPHSENDWQEDVLTVDTLPTGQKVDIKFDAKEKSQYWDIMVKDKDGASITWENIDLFTISQVTLNFDGTTPTATFDTPETTETSADNTADTNTQQVVSQDFSLVNNTGVEIYELYVSPHSENNWGEDVLTVDTLPTGQNAEIKFSPQEQSQYWDIMIKDQEGTSITWENVDLFSVSQVTLNFDGTTPTASFQ